MKKKSPLFRLGDLQLRILKVFWDRGEATIGDVHKALGGHSKFAYTTIATMLRKMEGRSLVSHREEGRVFVYKAEVEAKTVSRGIADHWMDRLFEGSLTHAVNHLLSTRDVSAEELRELERLIAERKRKP
ncbi:MAG TPA: BlaI/MecI/CopY family transcriptional regulator [Verrucomicrobiae bacterium]|nr:BlaI/MecI/CopY family transcriptional regulator [Verrucomicrobiae bacterium]